MGIEICPTAEVLLNHGCRESSSIDFQDDEFVMVPEVFVEHPLGLMSEAAMDEPLIMKGWWNEQSGFFGSRQFQGCRDVVDRLHNHQGLESFKPITAPHTIKRSIHCFAESLSLYKYAAKIVLNTIIVEIIAVAIPIGPIVMESA